MATSVQKMVTVTLQISVDALVQDFPNLKPYAGYDILFTVTSGYKVASYTIFPAGARACTCRVYALAKNCLHTNARQGIRKLICPTDGVMMARCEGSKAIDVAEYSAQWPNTPVRKDTPTLAQFITQPHVFNVRVPLAPTSHTTYEVRAIDVLSPLVNAYLHAGESLLNAVKNPLTENEVVDQLVQMLQGDKPSSAVTPTTPAPRAAATALTDLWTKVPMPEPTEYVVEAPTWRQCLHALGKAKNLLLVGPSGCGKTELVKYLGIQAKRDVHSFNFGGMTEPRTSLIGNVNFDPTKGTYFSESRFVKAVTTPDTIVLLDELSRAPRDAFNLLLPILDGQRYLSLDETDDGKVVKVAEGVTFVATANVGMEYTGTSALDRALKDRFTTLELGFPTHAAEKTLLEARTGVSPKFSEWLVKFANEQRKAAIEKEEFTELISTRMLLNAAEQLVFGIPLIEALNYCILGVFSGEGGVHSDREKAMQFVRAVIPNSALKV